MAVEEIFASLSQHMVQGIMFHENMVDYYNFLNLPGYAECHCYHAKAESSARRKLRAWFIRHCGKLVPYKTNSGQEDIPTAWYNYSRADVSPSDIRKAVKDGLERWVNWEKSTKQLYENSYSALINDGHIAAACFVRELVLDVAEELATAEQYLLNKKACDYDIGAILAEQEKDARLFRTKGTGFEN